LFGDRRDSLFVIPAKAGIQRLHLLVNYLDPGFRRGDAFLRVHQVVRNALCRN
jgi:hypothetical protein